MRTFRDSKGDSWEIDLPYGNISRVKSQSQGRFNLLDPNGFPNGEPPAEVSDEKRNAARLSAILFDDLGEFYEVLFLLVESQLVAKSVTPEDFGQRMAADCLLDAQAKFFQEWTDFFHKLQRPDAAKTLELLTRYHAKAVELAKAKANDPRMEETSKKVESAMESGASKRFSDSLEKLESTLDRIRGEPSM